ncbi:hypothetical protein B0H13DRAFT_2305564 [Mycena leptocephala]|nr:hypothetical protein B0H13DRAFT_2305564 [Mycena leptocephala]
MPGDTQPSVTVKQVKNLEEVKKTYISYNSRTSLSNPAANNNNNNNNNNNHNHHHLRWVVVVPAASSLGHSHAAVSSSAQDRPYPRTRFRHNNMINMIIDTSPIDPSHVPPFRPRQRRSSFTPIPRFNPRTVKFCAIRSRLSPITSRATCARYRLGRARQHRLTKQLDYTERLLHELHARVLHLLDAPILSPPTFACVIHDLERESSLCHALRAADCPHHQEKISFHNLVVIWFAVLD